MKSDAAAIFIHGTASSGRIWARLLESMGSLAPENAPGGGAQSEGSVLEATLPDGPPAVRPRIAVITPDIPGMGDAQVPVSAPLSFGDWLEYFRALRAGRRVHLVGHSLGGAIAIHLAEEPWVGSVTLISPATRAYCESRRSASGSGRNPGSIVVEYPLGRPVARPGSLSREDAKVLREDYAKAAALLAVGVPWPPYLRREAEYLRGKRVLLVYGEEDAIIPPSCFRELGAELAAAEVCVTVAPLSGCGHIPQLERPSDVARLIRSFWFREGLVT